VSLVDLAAGSASSAPQQAPAAAPSVADLLGTVADLATSAPAVASTAGGFEADFGDPPADEKPGSEGAVSEELVALDFPPEAPPAAQEAPAEAQERQAV
jgi:hypothetical protein